MLRAVNGSCLIVIGYSKNTLSRGFRAFCLFQNLPPKANGLCYRHSFLSIFGFPLETRYSNLGILVLSEWRSKLGHKPGNKHFKMTPPNPSQQPKQLAQKSAAKQLEAAQQLEAAKQLEDARMQDISLLLENLFEREEVTVKLLLDCLYDVGSVNLINHKFQSRFLNGTLKSVARLSKPAFRLLALRWFKKNCPQLLTNWLRSKVTFQDKKGNPPSPQTETKDRAETNGNGKGKADAPVVAAAATVAVTPADSSLSPNTKQPAAISAVESPNGTTAAIAQDSQLTADAQLTAEMKQLQSQVSLLTGLLIGAIALFGGGLFWLNYNLNQEIQPAQNAQSVKSGIGK